MERSILAGLVVYRWLAWAWMTTVLVLSRDDLVAPLAAWLLVGAALGVTVAATVRLRQDVDRLRSPRLVGVEVGVGAALLAADGWVYAAGHVFSQQQSLGVAWPLAGVIATGVVLGALAGGGAGVLMGIARAVSSVSNAAIDIGADEALSLLSTTVMYTLAGLMAGYITGLIGDAERRRAAAEAVASEARAREEIARTLHDGVLQTLAIVERRTEDAALARLARDQERDLRRFLFGAEAPGMVGTGDLGDGLRAAADRFERSFGGRVDVLVPDDLPTVADPVCEALVGAVGECLTNAGKHGAASRVVVYVEPQDGTVFCSVKDDGGGFDTDATEDGVGLRRSVRGRIAEVGGQVEITSHPGRGAEVRLTVPVASAPR